MKMEFREYECGCVGLYLESNPLKGDERPPIYRFQDCRRGGYEDDNAPPLGNAPNPHADPRAADD